MTSLSAAAWTAQKARAGRSGMFMHRRECPKVRRASIKESLTTPQGGLLGPTEAI